MPTKKTKTKQPLACCLCGQDIKPHTLTGWAGGHNANPVMDGRCCDVCNDGVVLPLRLLRLFKNRFAAEGS